MGLNEDSFDKLYLIDFGLSKIYVTKEQGHIESREGKSLLGDMLYASIANHEGREQSRRDDVESCIYLLIHLLTGGLPWSGLALNENMDLEDKNNLILEMKADFVNSDF